MLMSATLLGLGMGAAYQVKRRKTQQQGAQRRLKKQQVTDKVAEALVVTTSTDATVVSNNLNENERSFKNKLMIAVGSLGCAVVGSFGFPVLSAVSVGGVLYAGFPMFKRSWQSITQEKRVSGYVLTSIITSFTLLQHYFVYAAAQVVLVNISQRTLLKVKAKSRDGLLDIFSQQPSHAWLLVDGTEVEVPVDELKVGDTLIISAGETVPVDGSIIKGSAALDQCMLTGESQPVEKEIGDSVLASTLVLSGTVQVRVEKAGEETSIAQIGKVLNQTINAKTDSELRVEKLVDKASAPTLAFSALCVPFIGIAPAIFVLNNYLGPRTIALTSIGMMNYIKLLSDHGILIKDGGAIETLNQVDTIVFDKTGTLTSTQPMVRSITALSSLSEREILSYAAAAEQKQSHPIAKAILAEAKQQDLPVMECEHIEYEVGYGLNAYIKKQDVLVGSLRLMQHKGIAVKPEWEAAMQASSKKGHSTVWVAVNGTLAGTIELSPVVHPEVKNIITALKQSHVDKTYVISGDLEAPTQFLSKQLGIDHYYAEVLPQDKAALIQQLQEEGRTVCFVGDGINDAIALKQADVAISLSGATSIATDAAQIILMDGTVCQLAELFSIAKQFRSTFNRVIAVSVIPSLMGVAGVFSLNFGLWATFLVNQLNLSAVPMIMKPLAQAKQLKRLQ